ncbi:MAG: hypothetical protein Q7U14_16400, partial [Lacisediminimonas sp.]|nr:hypothetical protein [Lacisediminimonas sp.]
MAPNPAGLPEHTQYSPREWRQALQASRPARAAESNNSRQNAAAQYCYMEILQLVQRLPATHPREALARQIAIL